MSVAGARANAGQAVCLAAAASCALAALAGWLAGIPWLRDFGRGGYPTSPLTAIAVLFLCSAIATGIWGSRRISRFLLAPPFLIGMAALIHHVAGIGTPAPFAAGFTIPRPATTIEILLLTGTAALCARGRPRWARPVVLLSSLALAMCLLSSACFFLVRKDDPVLDFLVAALPTQMMAAALALCLLIHTSEWGWPGLLRAAGLDSALARTFVLVALLAPVATKVTERTAVDAGILSSVAAWLGEMGLTFLVTAGLLYWGASRMTREHRARLALTRALDAAPIALTDTSGNILHWSQGCEQLYGWSAAEARGRSKYELLKSEYPPSDRHRDVRPQLAPAWEEEIVEECLDGRKLHILEHGRLLESRHGGDSVLVLSMIDITDRTRAETALRESEARLSLAIEAHDIGVLEYDPADRKIHISPEIERKLGLQPGSIKDLASWTQHIDPADRDSVVKAFNSSISEGQARSRFRYRIGPEGARRTIEGSVSYQYDPEGRLDRIIGVGTDVTERMEAESRVASLQDVLMHVSRVSAMGEMAASLAHELNQPLAAIVNFLGAANYQLQHGQHEQAQELLEKASGQTLRAGEIIRRLRGFVSNRPANVQTEPVQEVVEDAVALALTGVVGHDIRIVVAVDETAPTMMADRVQIQQVLVNLIKNATEALRTHATESPKIMIRTRRTGDNVDFVVEDNGPGLSKKALTHLYEPFASTKSGGMGIGLSICRRIIEAHGGELRATNNRSGGATFRFTVKTCG